LFIGHGNFLRGNAQRRYLIILATVFNLLRQHKMQTKYIFVFIKEWHKKAPLSGAVRTSTDTFRACQPGWENVRQGSVDEMRVHPLAADAGDVHAYASDKLDSHERQPLNENFAVNRAKFVASE